MRKRSAVFVIIFLTASGFLFASADSSLPPKTEEAALLMLEVHNSATEGFRQSGERCATCHGNVFVNDNIFIKTLSPDGQISEDLYRNHHWRHEKTPSADFGTDCTYCHAQFEVAQNDAGYITVSSYVDKTSCAACHSPFNPTGRMAEEYIADGCPGCHGEGDDWMVWHFDGGYAPDIARRFVDTYNIPFGTDWCLECHGFNRYITSPQDQAAWWGMSFEERNAYMEGRGQPWIWVEPEPPQE